MKNKSPNQAPTAYRPQQRPTVLQKKTPVAPPVYRPEAKKIVQPKVAGVTSLRPQAPPVYRPQPMPKVLQTKQSPNKIATVQKHPANVKERALLPHERSRVIQRKQSSAPGVSRVPEKATVAIAPRPATTPVSARYPVVFGVVQRAARAKAKAKGKGAKPRAEAKAEAPPLVEWTLEDIEEGVTDFAKLLAGEDVSKQAARILKQTVPLSEFFGVSCNCYGWALGDNRFRDPGNTLSTWKHHLSKEYTFVDADAADATIILWGVPIMKDEAKIVDYQVQHASVLLTHEQLRARKEGEFPKIAVDAGTYQRIPNPFWSSAMGAGYGIMYHAKDFFENGVFGKAIAGMKKK